MTDFVEAVVQREHELIENIFTLTGGLGAICGGFARYALSPKANPVVPGDIDIFCASDEEHDKIFSRLKEHQKIKLGRELPIATEFTYNLREGFLNTKVQLQLIKPINAARVIMGGDPLDVIGNFDFSITRAAILPSMDAIVDPNFDEDERHGVLRIRNIHCPVAAIKRINKYVLKGYTIQTSEFLKLFKDWDARDNDWKNLITEGLNQYSQGIFSDGPDAPWAPEKQAKFQQAMYFD